MELSELSDFVAVARHGSFVEAAKATGTPKTTLSRRIQVLEQNLQLRLFERTTRTVRLTDDGAAFLERASRLVSDATELEREMRDRGGEPVGLLRIAVPTMLGLEFMGSATATLRSKWPKMTLKVAFTDRRVDLLEENFDCAIRSGPLPDASLIARRVAVYRNILVAAPQFAEGLGQLKSPEGLAVHPTISFAPHGVALPWILEEGGRPTEIRPRSAIVLGSLRAAAQAAAAGAGVAFVPDIIANEDISSGRLEHVLPEWQGEGTAIYVVYPAHRTPSAKVRAFADLLSGMLASR